MERIRKGIKQDDMVWYVHIDIYIFFHSYQDGTAFGYEGCVWMYGVYHREKLSFWRSSMTIRLREYDVWTFL